MYLLIQKQLANLRSAEGQGASVTSGYMFVVDLWQF